MIFQTKTYKQVFLKFRTYTQSRLKTIFLTLGKIHNVRGLKFFDNVSLSVSHRFTAFHVSFLNFKRVYPLKKKDNNSSEES